jgi:hypothetical protein
VRTGALTFALAVALGFAPAALAKGGGGGGGGSGGGGPPGQSNAPGQNDGNGRGNGSDAGRGSGKSDVGRSETGKADRPGRGGVDSKSARDQGDTARDKAQDKAGAKASLGALNAAHASPTARANASPNSRVGQIAAYERAMQSALAIQDPAKRASAITEARALLDDAANKPVTPAVVERVDALLGLDTTQSAPAKP